MGQPCEHRDSPKVSGLKAIIEYMKVAHRAWGGKQAWDSYVVFAGGDNMFKQDP